MSEKDMLGAALTLRDAKGPLGDLMGKLAGEDGPEWLSGLKRFLRKQEAWTNPEKPSRKKSTKRFSRTPSNSLEVDLDMIDPIPVEWQGKGMVVETHDEMGKVRIELKDGELYVNDVRLALYCSPKQEASYEGGNGLRKHLTGKACYNANLLDVLVAHPHLIPESWKGKYVYFWKTIYRGSDGGLYVRCLYWDGSRWRWGHRWLDDRWDADRPALVSAQ